jgi:hypothetical protein
VVEESFGFEGYFCHRHISLNLILKCGGLQNMCVCGGLHAPPPAKGLLRRGFFGTSFDSSPSPPTSTLAVKEVFQPPKSSGDSFSGAVALGERLHLPVLSESKSRLRYSWQVKEDLGVQLNKKLNKKLIAEAVAATPTVGVDSEVVLNAMIVAPTL